MSKFFSNIFATLAGLWKHDIEPDVEAAIIALAHSLVSGGGSLLVSAAASAVAAAEATGGTGSAKFSAAQNSVVNALVTGGIPVVVNSVNAAIEAAVAQQKISNGTAAPIRPAP